jgi:hypothetical protein
MSRASDTQNSSKPRSQQITLSALGLERTSVLEPESFTFVGGESVYRCSKFQAVFLSKTVSDLFLTDPLTAEFVIDDIPDPEHDFGLIWNVLQHGNLEVTERNVLTLQQFTQRLKCDELDRLLFEFAISGEDLNAQNAVSRLLLKSSRVLTIDEEVEFIASHLDEIESLGRLSPSLLEIVLESTSLQIESEDWLLELICGLGSEYENLIRYVRCEFLSSGGIDKFIEAVALDQIDSVLWNSVCCRLKNTCSSSVNPRRIKGWRFSHGGSDFEGILHHLSVKHGGNVHTKGVVTITASSRCSGWKSVETIADFAQRSNWLSDNISDSWVQFDFKELKVSVSGYSVNSHYRVQLWDMEVSNDGSSWVRIDRRSTNELNNSNVVKYFDCNLPSAEFHRYVRMHQTGVNGYGNHRLGIGNLEFFGRLRRVDSNE